MTAGQILGNMTWLKGRLRRISTSYDRLEDRKDAINVIRAAVQEMSTLHTMLPKPLQDKAWVFLSLERGRAHHRPAGWR